MSPRGTRPMPGLPDGARRRTSAELDALLDGGSSGDLRLDQVLSSARAPGRHHELALPAPAVGAGAPVDRPSRLRRGITRLGAATLFTKGLTAAVGAAAIGAAAVAGATHHLPGQHQPGPSPSATVAPSVSPDRSNGRTHSHPSSSSAHRTSTSPSISSSPSSPATTPKSTSSSPSPTRSNAVDIPALCRVWLALPALSDIRNEPRFSVLIQAAGGVEAVTPYCRALPTKSPSSTGKSHGSATASGTSSSSPSTSTSPDRSSDSPGDSSDDEPTTTHHLEPASPQAARRRQGLVSVNCCTSR